MKGSGVVVGKFDILRGVLRNYLVMSLLLRVVSDRQKMDKLFTQVFPAKVSKHNLI